MQVEENLLGRTICGNKFIPHFTLTPTLSPQGRGRNEGDSKLDTNLLPCVLSCHKIVQEFYTPRETYGNPSLSVSVAIFLFFRKFLVYPHPNQCKIANPLL